MNVYLDLDGVMADFEGHYLEIFGHKHDSVTDAIMWHNINQYHEFFLNLPPLSDALDFFKSIEHMNPIILTACPKSNYNVAAIQKREWVRKQLSKTCWVLPVLGGKNKSLFMHEKNDILIDDFEDNIKYWNLAGGIGILHREFESTYDKLMKILNEHS